MCTCNVDHDAMMYVYEQLFICLHSSCAVKCKSRHVNINETLHYSHTNNLFNSICNIMAPAYVMHMYVVSSGCSYTVNQS